MQVDDFWQFYVSQWKCHRDFQNIPHRLHYSKTFQWSQLYKWNLSLSAGFISSTVWGSAFMSVFLHVVLFEPYYSSIQKLRSSIFGGGLNDVGQEITVNYLYNFSYIRELIIKYLCVYLEIIHRYIINLKIYLSLLISTITYLPIWFSCHIFLK